MKSAAAFAGSFVVLSLLSSSAFAQDEDKAPTERKELSIGYQLEGGVASTHMVRGAPKYDTKRTPATEDSMMIRLKNLGPGTLQLGTSFALALDHTVKKHGKSEEIVPIATYGGKLGPIQADVGMRVWTYPRMDQPRQDVEIVGRFSMPNKYIVPTFDVYPSIAEKQGASALLGVERRFNLTSWLSVRPRCSYGMQGYDLNREHFHAHDFQVSSQVTAQSRDGFYASVRPLYSYLTGPSEFYKDPTFSGRSTGYIGMTFGVQR